MTNYKIILLTGILLTSGFAHADKIKGMRSSAPYSQPNKITTGNCPNTTAQFDLRVNNVRARILTGGDMWWDPIGQVNYYEVPIGSNKNSLYTGAIWIGGFDGSGALKIAAQTYRQQGSNDMWAGPISKDPVNGTTRISDTRCAEFDRFWYISKAEVENFVNTGEVTDVIKEWPGNGNVANNELPLLAPFFDANNDGVYDYTTGDYPNYNLSGNYAIDNTTGVPICNDYLFGDNTLWWVFNDVGNTHTETNSDPIGIEIRAQAFAFRTADEINNMTFYKYQIINRSSETLNQTYMGQWADPDLGDATDDYVGCDVSLGLGFVYNSDAEDDASAGGYGLNPPALGIDFFQGPLADPNDLVDNDLDSIYDEPGEQIIMSKFVYYKNTNNTPDGNPAVTDDYYQYLSGKWLDGVLITHGHEGRTPGDLPCNYMFPGTTDPAFTDDWTMSSAGIQGNDMRFLESAGTFTLGPGAVNYVTTGVVWARTSNGGPLASVNLIKLADRKAQALFDNCFKVLDGPDAPDLAIREMDKQLILSLENTKGPKVENYFEVDPVIPTQVPGDTGGFITLTDAERSYKFEGYKVYQIKDKTVGANDLTDVSKAKLIQQIDIQNDIIEIVNFNFDNALNVWTPVKVTDNVNTGIVHTINLTIDYFTGQSLINYKPYYYMVVSYAYNNFRPFDLNNAAFTQSKPYVQGRNNVKVYSGIPHKPFLNNGGTVLNTTIGATPGFITRIEGQGNGGKILDLTEATINEILTDTLHRAKHPVYQEGRGPVRFTVYDPFKVVGGSYTMKFDGVADTSKWSMFFTGNLSDLIDRSAFGIGVTNEEIFEIKGEATGLTINASKGADAGYQRFPFNGFLEGTKTYSDPSKQWLTGVVDDDNLHSSDWIRAGVAGGGTDMPGSDPAEVYEDVIGGTWAPFLLTDKNNSGSPKFNNSLLYPSPTNPATISWSTLNSVDIVITRDKSKWSRSVVLKSTDVASTSSKYNKRFRASVDKDGIIGNGIPSSDPNDADYIDSYGMSWFPGYAINIETGERLNIAFAEDTTMTSDNGDDMLWNPTSRIGDSNGDTIFGGRHYIYIFNKVDADSLPNYDGCNKINSLIKGGSQGNKVKIFKSCIWTSLPLISDDQYAFQGNMPPTDVKIRLRIAKSYAPFVSIGETPLNNGNPYYEFTIPDGIAASKNVVEVAKSALDNISVVPNPYYAYSSYEKTREDQLDSRIRFINLPSHCTISIYTTNGTLIRQFKRDVAEDVSEGQALTSGQDYNLSSTLDWNLKNTAGIPIASGVYIVHVDAGALGEKVIKWFGIMRPLDLTSF